MLKKPGYNLRKNLIKASVSDIYDIAIDEWLWLETIIGDETDKSKCICSRLVWKQKNYLINLENGKVIMAGSMCYKDINVIEDNSDGKKLLRTIILKILQGKYEDIDDINKYCMEIKQELINHLSKQKDTYFNNYDELLKLKLIIADLLKEPKYAYLQEINVEVNLQIQTLEKQIEEALATKVERQRLEDERQEQQRQERERQEREARSKAERDRQYKDLLQEEAKQERLERERREEEEDSRKQKLASQYPYLELCNCNKPLRIRNWCANCKGETSY